MAFTTARTWVAGETVTAALLNTHVRDNTQHVYNAISGVDTQNVAVHANKTLTQGGLRAQRHPYANERHMESGTNNHGSLNAGTNSSGVAITFSNAYASAPSVVVSATGSTYPAESTAAASNVTTTGFTLTARNLASVSQTVVACWQAEGAD